MRGTSAYGKTRNASFQARRSTKLSGVDPERGCEGSGSSGWAVTALEEKGKEGPLVPEVPSPLRSIPRGPKAATGALRPGKFLGVERGLTSDLPGRGGWCS